MIQTALWIGIIALSAYFLQYRFGLLSLLQTLVFKLSQHKPQEQHQLSPYQKWKQFKPTNQGVPIDGHNKRLSLMASFRNIAVTGGTGSGKTRYYVQRSIHKLALSRRKPIMIVTDPASETLSNSQKHLKEQGYDIYQFNLINPEKSHKFNPLLGVKTKMMADEVAQALVSASSTSREMNNDMFWMTGAINLISFAIQLLAKEPGQATLPKVLEIVQLFGKPLIIEERVKKVNSTSLSNQLNAILAVNPRVFTSFLAIANNSLRLFANEEIARILNGHEISFERGKPYALFIITPTDRVAVYASLVSLLYTQLFRSFMAKLPEKKDLPVFIILDEFANLTPNISDFNNILTTCRKYAVSISIILQSTAQLRENANVILEGGVNTRLFYGSLDSASRRFIYNTNRLNISGVGHKKVLFMRGNYPPMVLKVRVSIQGMLKKYLEKLLRWVQFS